MTPPYDSFSFPLRLGFGCSGAWAQKWHSEKEARRILLSALEAGVRHIDTAGFYAGGEAERRLGAALKEFGEPVFVSTKTGTRYTMTGARKDFSEDAIRRDVEASLRRLGRERLDLVYLHGPSADEESSGLDVLGRLRDEGKIERIGVCGDGAGLVRAAGDARVDVVMGVYNFLRRTNGAAFEKAKARGVGVVAIAPLAQGLYAKDFFGVRSRADGWRIVRAIVKNRSELIAARRARPALESAPGWTPGEVALAFTLANPSIDVAVTNTTSARHLAESISAATRQPPTDALQRLAAGFP